MQTDFTPSSCAIRRPRGRDDPADLRALRLLHRDLPDLRAARRRARQPARPHLPDQGRCWRAAARRRAEVVKHIDRCLSCLACMTTCPSGVHYMHLVDHAPRYIEETYRGRCPTACMRGLLGDRPAAPAACSGCALVGAAAGAAASRRLLPAARLRAMLELAPRRASRRRRRSTGRRLSRRRASAARGWRCCTGCAQQVLAPEINEATVRLLTRHGVEVVVAAGCRLLRRARPSHGQGATGAARSRAPTSTPGWRELDGQGLDAVVINASGCGTTVKDYGFMFARGSGLRGEGGARSRARQGHHRAHGRDRTAARGADAGPGGRLSLGLLDAARPAGHASSRSSC